MFNSQKPKTNTFQNNQSAPQARSSIGGVWIKQDKNGNDYLSITVEIQGVKHNFSAFQNKYKQEGDNKPAFTILPPRE